MNKLYLREFVPAIPPCEYDIEVFLAHGASLGLPLCHSLNLHNLSNGMQQRIPYLDSKWYRYPPIPLSRKWVRRFRHVIIKLPALRSHVAKTRVQGNCVVFSHHLFLFEPWCVVGRRMTIWRCATTCRTRASRLRSEVPCWHGGSVGDQLMGGGEHGARAVVIESFL